MPAKRTLGLIGAVLGTAAVLVAAGFFLTRDESPAAHGELIAYACKEQNNPWFAVCAARVDGTDEERLTDGLPTTDPAWSPDGRRIAFTRNEEAGEFTTFTNDDVFVMDADGSNVRELVANGEGRSLSQPAWSPDGSQVAYVDGESVANTVPSRYGDLFVVDDDGSEAQRLTSGPDADPDWSARDEIVFIRGENLPSPRANDDVWVRDVATGTERQLTRTPPGTFEAAPAWSPDGSLIAFARVTGGFSAIGTATIHLMNRDGTGERQVLSHELSAYRPYSLSWSPDGRTIAYETSTAIGCVSISLLDVASGSVRPLTSCSRPRETTVAPAWQPALDSAD
jgi:TolB protein